MTREDKIKHLKWDILNLHLPRIIDSVEKEYYDENQAMVLVDHIMRARILKENSDD